MKKRGVKKRQKSVTLEDHFKKEIASPVITFVSIFIIGAIIVALLNIAGPITGNVTAEDTVLDKIIGPGGLSSAFEKLSSSSLFAQFLLFILVALIVYAVLVSIELFRGKEFIVGAVSVVVAILSTFFLKSTEVATILISYGALGITLTGLLPFILIMVIAKQLADAGYEFLNIVLWVVFFVITIIRWLTASSAEIGTFGGIVYPILLGLVGAMFFMDKQLWKWFRKGKTEGTIEKLEDTTKLASAGNISLAEYVKRTTRRSSKESFG